MMLYRSKSRFKIPQLNSLKYFFVLPAFLFFSIKCQAKNYYLSSSTGNDSYTSTQAQSTATPWQSISKLNSFMSSLVSGDYVYFKNGDTFYGTLTPSVSGVTFGAYGSGAKPIITGLTTISSWTSLGSNIWEAVVPGGLSSLNMVLISGKLTPMGRWPNKDAANAGYKMYTSFVNNVSITDPTLTSSPNWTGAEIVVRKRDFATTRTKITGHSASTLSFSISGGSGFLNNQGYFVENSLATLDQNGEWYYDPATKKIKIFYTSTPPTIQVSTLLNLVSMVYSSGAIKSNITFRGITFKGCEDNIFQVTYCNYLTIDNCDLTYAGTDAIDTRYAPYLNMTNSTITDINSVGFREFITTSTHHTTFKNNTVRRVALYPGMLSNNNSFYNETEMGSGLQIGSANFLAQENIFDSIGYCAIRMSNDNNLIIRKNRISNFCSIKNDGGAIYLPSRTLGVTPVSSGVIIDSNIISNSNNAAAGTPFPLNPHVRAIYLDRNSTNIKILNNTVFTCWEGIYLSKAQYNTVRGNTIYDCGFSQDSPASYAAAMPFLDAGTGDQHTTHNIITKNILCAKYTNQLLLYSYDTYYAMDSIGVIDSNYYVNPGSNARLVTYNPTYPNTYYTLAQWKAAHPKYDAHSFESPKTTPVITSANVDSYLRFEYNATNTAKTISLNANYIGVDKTIYNTGSITLQPYSSKVLLKDTGNVVAAVPPPTGTGLTAKATAGAINCTGTTTVITVSATGGSSPYTGTGTFTTNAGKGSLKISFPTSVSTVNTVLIIPVGSITVGKTYILRFSTLGTTTNGKLNLLIRKTASPSNMLVAAAQTATFGNSRVDHQFIFTPTISDASGSVNIEINQSSGTTYFDNIAFFEATSAGSLIGSNLVSNGQFETDITGTSIWSSNNNQVAAWDATSRIGNTNYYTVSDATGAKSTVGIAILQSATPLSASSKAGTITTVGGSTTVTVSASGGRAAYTGTGTFTVTAGTYNYVVKDANGCSVTTSITVTQPAARVANGTLQSTIPLDTATNRIGSINTSNTLKISSYPNPTSSEFRLIVEGGSIEKIGIVVVSVEGRMVFQTSGTSNKIYTFGDTFQPGLYIIKVVQGNTVQTLKVIKI